MRRITGHPILPVVEKRDIPFSFNGMVCTAQEGEVISSALTANGIDVFGHHIKDHAAQGLFCANGQCAHCMVIADGMPVKACMTRIQPGMSVMSCEGLPALPEDDRVPDFEEIRTMPVQVLIIGGGPAGISAALELAKLGVRCLLVDNKHRPGGKLTLQTHSFFGSREECRAGMRGTDIAHYLEEELESCEKIDVWLDSPAVGVFSDKTVGIVRQGRYVLVRPDYLLVATGAREKPLAFPGCDLPGVIGAGAFQTLVNRDLVRPSERVFICGGGNVGLITGYHALQAGIDVTGLAEIQEECGGYAVHLDKLKRLGVGVFTSHAILHADGEKRIESVTIGRVDRQYQVIPGTEKRFDSDTLLIAVGLDPVNELFIRAREYGFKTFRTGDAEAISEASAAMINGRIQARMIARSSGLSCSIPDDWKRLSDLFMQKPGQRKKIRTVPPRGDVYPVIRCDQEIPCNPCVAVCPNGSIHIEGDGITALPYFDGECTGCGRCVLICPGLAITLVDESWDPKNKTARITLPFEFTDAVARVGDRLVTTGFQGEIVGTGLVAGFRRIPKGERRRLMLIDVPWEDRTRVAGFRIRKPKGPESGYVLRNDDPVICRCERVRKSDIVDMIRNGCRDMNQIKAMLGTGMGACGGRTCTGLILELFREEGIDPETVSRPVYRPPEIEIPLGRFAGVQE